MNASSESKKELVSIIIPVYNAEEYLQRCLDSVIKQTYQNIEILIINDGSTDNSFEICESYRKKDERIEIINQDNLGSAKSRYNALQRSRGGYIAFVDSDDWIEPNMIETAMLSLRKYEADLCIFNYEANGIAQGKWNNAILNNNHAILMEYYDGRIHNKLWNKIIKKSIYSKVIFPNGKNRDIKEDAAIMSQVLLYANKAIRLKECLYHYSIIKESLSRKRKHTKIELAGEYRNEFDKLILLYKALPEKRGQIKEEITALIKEQVIRNINFNLQEIKEAITVFFEQNRSELKDSFIAKVSRMNYKQAWWYVLYISLLPGENHSFYNVIRMIKNKVKK